MRYQLKSNTSLQGGKYWIEKTLGQGGFGITYIGYDADNERRVAIKEFFMKKIVERDEKDNSVIVSDVSNYSMFREQKEKFRKEAQRLNQFDSNHIVRVFNQFEENNTAYYVMEYIEGENLREYMDRTGQALTEQQVWDLLPQVLDALNIMHHDGIWHLDLKPGNIMVDNNNNVKLIDFGATKQIDAVSGGATARTTVTFTEGYAPTEQMEKKYEKFGPWTDFYALGATIYALLTNSRPPLPTNIDEDKNNDKRNALPLPSSISGKMRNLIVWMMNTNRRLRPQSVNEILIKYFPSSDSDTLRQEETEYSQSYYNQEETEFTSGRNEETEYSKTYNNNGQTNFQYNCQQSKQSKYQEESEEEDNSIAIVLAAFAIIALIICVGIFVANHINSQAEVEEPHTPPTTTTSSTTYGKKDVYYDSMGYGTYEGGLKNGEMHGHGIITYSSGQRFTGEFNNGVSNGHGTLTSSTGKIIFDGDYLNGSRIRGTETFENGNTFKGTYQYGHIYEGTLTSPDGEIIGKGEFFDGKIYNGYGREKGTYTDGTKWEFAGNYKNGKWNGKGIEIWPNQEEGYLKRYDGSFKDGKRCGYGIGEYQETRVGYIIKYEGNWADNKRNGYGVAEYNESRYNYILMYKGHWKNGYRSGEGTAYWVGGSYTRGNWKEGRLENEMEHGTWR